MTALGGEAAPGPTGVTLDILQGWKRERLAGGQGYRVGIGETVLREPLHLPSEHSTAFVAPLTTRDVLSGIMVVSLPGVLPRTVEDALESLTSQVALALESAALTEDLLIQQSQARFASLVKNSSDLVMLIEPDTTVTYASPSAERVLGHPRRGAGGHPLLRAHPRGGPRPRPDVPHHRWPRARATRASPSSAWSTATGRSARWRRSARTCCTTRT